MEQVINNNLKLGYLGPKGTFSHDAALVYAGRRNAELFCCGSLDEIFNRVQGGQLHEGIVPVENSTGGSVGATHDLLLNKAGVYIVDELILPVRQCLLVQPGVSMHAIEKVYSHPQALAQCRSFLQTCLPGVPMAETTSTAAAAAKVAAADRPLAGIGSTAAATAYGLTILRSGIESNQNNVTRFLVLAGQSRIAEGLCKTSLAVAVHDQPGALYHILREFAWRGINLTRIKSSPAGGKLGDYVFFIDMAGSTRDRSVMAALDELRQYAAWVKIWGSYPAKGGLTEPRTQPPSDWDSLDGLRRGIDVVDTEIMQLLALRGSLVDRVACYKADAMAVVDGNREKQIIARVRKKARRGDLDEDLVEQIYRLIFQGSVDKQRQLLQKQMDDRETL